MNRFLMRLSMVLMAFLFITGCHQWQSDHNDCVTVGETHYAPSDVRPSVWDFTPKLTSKDYILSSQIVLAQLAYHSLVPKAEAATAFGGSIVMSLVVQRALGTQAANAALAIADQYIVLANNARAAGQTAEAAKFMSESAIWEAEASIQAQRAGAATEAMLFLGATAGSPVSALGVLMPSQYVIDQWMQGNFGYYDGYYYDQASNRGYDHMQGAGVLDGWLDGRHGGSGGSGGDSDHGDVCEYDNYFMPAGDPKGDDPCKDHRKKGKSIFPRTEEPTGTFTLQVLLGSGHWQDTVMAMQQHQLETEMPLALVYEAKVLGHMDFPFIRTYTMVWPQGYTTTYYQDPSSGEMVFAFGAEINGQFLDVSTGEYYGEMYPGQAEVTVYTGNHVYGVDYQ